MSDRKIDFGPLTDVMGVHMETPAIHKAMVNMSQMAQLNVEEQTPEPYLGFTFKPASMGLWKRNNDLQIVFAVAGGEPQYVALDKFIPLVEHMDDSRKGTIVLQNHRPPTPKEPAREQVIARIVARCSAVNIFRGNPGVIINEDEDIRSRHSFQVDRAVLAVYYLAAKLYLGNDERIRQMVAATEGMRSYEIRATNCERDDLMLAAKLIG
ncbi:MAG: hypothetical protein FDZ69_00210 [Deltaproteobacteria bacterium]|nr:MAG: hypothetical protein FDZ69_00210 [Deltaproteobacteria bacterium]